VLVIDDDAGTTETFGAVLRPEGFRVGTAACGADGLAMARSGAFDVLLIDQRLPDMLGTDLARSIRQEYPDVPFVLMSAWLTTEVTVVAMRLGASNVIEKPLTLETMRDAVLSALHSQPEVRIDRRVAEDEPSGCAAERWAAYVLNACDSDRDPRTLKDWGRIAFASKSTLIESCYLVGIQPRDARDFTRLLRALIRSKTSRCQPEALLAVRDRRTLGVLIHRAGLGSRSNVAIMSVREFLTTQRLIATDNEALRVLSERLLSGGNGASRRDRSSA
jgi:DNA-binding response OmpR family regulator